MRAKRGVAATAACGGTQETEQLTRQRAESERAVASLTTSHDQRRAEVRQVEQQRAQAQQDLAKLTEDMAARNRDLAEVNGKLQSARQALADAQSKLAGARQQLWLPARARWRPAASARGAKDASARASSSI